jgi:hypothetical protein
MTALCLTHHFSEDKMNTYFISYLLQLKSPAIKLMVVGTSACEELFLRPRAHDDSIWSSEQLERKEKEKKKWGENGVSQEADVCIGQPLHHMKWGVSAFARIVLWSCRFLFENVPLIREMCSH